MDARRDIVRLVARLEIRLGRSALGGFCSLSGAAIVAYLPAYAGLGDEARHALFILLSAVGLWVTEAIPAFATALLVVGLAIALLGPEAGSFTAGVAGWERFLASWSSSLVWLFFGGFVLAAGAQQSGLDRRLAGRILDAFGTAPRRVLAGSMSVTFILSMFISNTATTVVVLSMLRPALASLREQPLGRALGIGIVVAANLGGMATLIGSPPNAIAAGLLQASQPVDFLMWMAVGLPPALVLTLGVYGWLAARWLPRQCDCMALRLPVASVEGPRWRRWLVVASCSLTVALWIASPWHGVPTPVVSFLPVVVFTFFGVLSAESMRALPWDVLLLLAGGLTLGQVVQETGLLDWLLADARHLAMSAWSVAFLLSYVCSLASNLMSNTAAANLLLPLAMALGAGTGGAGPAIVALPVALAASSAMCLPMSTPPNALVHGQGLVASRDLLRIGAVVSIFCPLIAVPWCQWLSRIGW